MTLHPFRNDYDDYDFTALSDVIASYYPVTSQERLTDDTVLQWQGTKKISARVEQEFMNQKTYREKWGKFGSLIKKKLKKHVSIQADLLSGSCLTGEIIVNESKLEDFAHTKTLNFHISILGPFFTMYGVDSSTVFSKLDYTYGPQTGNFDAINALTISPLFEYEALFKALEKEIREYFPGYRFVPYRIGMSTINNISIDDGSRNPRMMDTVYEGIFGTRSVHECLVRGDDRYGFKDWLKPQTNSEKLLHDLISEHIRNAPQETTLHKVWKLKESKALDTFTRTGNLMFDMDLFDVIDFTDPSEVIIISDRERQTIGKIPYTIKGNILTCFPNVSFRIAEVTADTLTLFVTVDLQHGNVSLKGEIKELKLIQMLY